MEMSSRKQRVINELLAHLPFSIFFTAAGMIMAGILLYISIVTAPVPADHDHDAVMPVTGEAAAEPAEGAGSGGHHHHLEALPHNPGADAASGIMFHLFHPIHLMLSAIATTAMFWRHEKKFWKSVIVGFIGSVGVCGLSDVFMPYLSGRLLGVKGMHFHWCLIEHPQMVLPFVILGIACGIIAADRVGHSTKFSHSSHIFVSVVASLFYLISYGVGNWVAEDTFPYVFVIVILCVTVPCCFSDIIFPVLSASCAGETCCGHAHD